MTALPSRRRILGVAALALLTAPLVGCAAASEAAENANEPTVIRLGLAPDEDSAAVLDKYEPFVAYLEHETGLEIEPYVGADYTAVIEALNSGHLDLAWFGPSEYVLATEAVDGGVEAFAAAVQDEDTVPYRSSFVVRADSDIEGPDDFEGAVMAFTDPASTSGHIFGRYALEELGYDTDALFSQVVYSGSHDASLLSLVNGQVDVAAISSRKIPGFIESGLIGPDDVRVVLESSEIPADPITFRSDLPETTKELLRDAFLGDSPDLGVALEGTGFAGFGPVDDADFDLVRDAYEATGLEPSL